MTEPIRRPGRGKRKAAFSLRQTILCFGLVAIIVCGVGLTLKLAVRAADNRPAVAVATAAVALATGVAVRSVRRRREERGVPAALAVGQPEAEAGAVAPVETFASTDYAAMEPADFEQAIAALCERDGCREVRVVGGAGDLGADVVATTADGRRIVIQCKRYGPTNKVGSQDVQRFGGTCFAVHEAHVAAVVTTGEFTQPAAEYAEQCGILCVDHTGLVAWTDGTGPAPWEELVAGTGAGRP
ncbi:restriction endonuclease [Streptomyces flavidovirens]|uniref:restriction endonuclease n=1 Tax=Streptomyces flavidovirens TaxID=67298 RepID=UPI00040212E7|nr:restriction endonuclease [Streptomyces flavidovirens]